MKIYHVLNYDDMQLFNVKEYYKWRYVWLQVIDS